jgi:predicted AAA+ superfamily ATPase
VRFSRFLEAASFSQGSVLNTSEIARESMIKRSLADSYFEITRDLLIGFHLPVFAKRAKRKLVSQSKFYFFDVGVWRSIRPSGPLDSGAETDGVALETLVMQELRSQNDYLGAAYELYYWRTKHGLEVDFVLYGEGGLIAIEVKRSRTYSSKDLRGLKEFRRDYEPAQCYLFYGGSTTEYVDGVTVLPVEKALQKLPEILLNKLER